MKPLNKYQTPATMWMLFCVLVMTLGCEFYGPHPYRLAVVIEEPPVVVVTTVEETQLLGLISVTGYAPALSSLTADTESVIVTVRDGGAYGPVLIEPTEFQMEANGTVAIDVVDMPYGYYDIEMVGLDLFGNNVSYAAAGISLTEPIASLSLELEAVTFSGSVYLDIVEPADDGITGPAVSLDYILWEKDTVTGELTFVEEMTQVPLDGWNLPVIENLELGEYTIEVYGFNVFDELIYDAVAEFSHEYEETVVPIFFWYSL